MNAACGSTATAQSPIASIEAERGSPSIAAISPKMPPGRMSRKLTCLPWEE